MDGWMGRMSGWRVARWGDRAISGYIGGRWMDGGGRNGGMDGWVGGMDGYIMNDGWVEGMSG